MYLVDNKEVEEDDAEFCDLPGAVGGSETENSSLLLELMAAQVGCLSIYFAHKFLFITVSINSRLYLLY